MLTYKCNLCLGLAAGIMKCFFFLKKKNQEMESSCKRLIGEHDFRNFCKMDAANVHNYKRRITSFDICHCNGRFEFKHISKIKDY